MASFGAVNFLSSRAGPARFDDFTFVFHIDVAILLCFGFFAAFTLPRLFVRVSRRSEWFSGLYLRAPVISSLLQKPKRNRPPTSVPNNLAANRDPYIETGWLHARVAQLEKEMHEKDLPPRSILSWSSRFHVASALLGRELAPGYTIGRLLVLLGYFGFILYAGVYKGSPFQFWTREGIITASQVPIVFALATKNNLLGAALAVGYEKLNWLHRFLGRLMLVLASIHALGFFYTWSSQGRFTTVIKEPLSIRGLVALIGLNLLAWFSVPFFRKNYYNVFVVAHVVGLIMFPVGLGLHAPPARPFIYAGVGVYLFDHLLRVLKTRIVEAYLVSIPELGMTRIDVPRLGAGWRPGQHVRIRVISSGMGWFGLCESHPFTIACVSGDGLVLMCKKAGDWTNKLYKLAQSKRLPAGEEDMEGGASATVIVEGPYGGVGHTLMDTFSGALFFSGGSGITFSLAAIQNLVLKDVDGRSRVKVIELVWSVKDANSLTPMLPMFTSLIDQAPFTELRITVFYTRAPKVPVEFKGDLPENITVAPGRPEISDIITSTIDRTCALSSSAPLGLVVGVCGPAGLGQHVRDAVGKVDTVLRNNVGGIELCEEIFGL